MSIFKYKTKESFIASCS